MMYTVIRTKKDYRHSSTFYSKVIHYKEIPFYRIKYLYTELSTLSTKILLIDIVNFLSINRINVLFNYNKSA